MDKPLIFQDMERFADEHNVPIIKMDGAELLVETVKKYQPQKVLEIGTAIGYSTILIGYAAPNATITTIEIHDDRASTAEGNIKMAGMDNRIQVIVGDASKVIDELNDTFDMVFIDAAKGQYLRYLQKVLGKLRNGAVVFADNVLFRDMVDGNADVPRRYRTIVKRLREYLIFVNTDQRFQTTLHKIGDGVAISIYQGANDF